MKNVTGAVTTDGNVNHGDSEEMQIDGAAMGIVMEILSKMYSDGYLAVLREYSCNARDAHVAVGNTDPIRVTLPSALNPSLLIRDFGPGLDKQGLVYTFGTYGASTKRETNDQVGAFGIGSKSAFTMGQQFTVTGIKDGVKTVALFALNEQNVGTVNVLHEADTDEPNGVLVSLAVKDVDRMHSTAAKFFSTWEKGTVLVNGADPDYVWDRGHTVADGVHLIPGESEVAVVMGGVAYPVSRSIMRSVADRLEEAGRPGAPFARSLASWGGNAVYFSVEIGDVDIAPTREALRDTNRSFDALGALLDVAASQALESVQEAVSAAPNHWEAYRVFNTQRDLMDKFPVPFQNITWNGKRLDQPAQVELPHAWLATKSRRASRMTLHQSAGRGHYDSLTVDRSRMDRVLVVTGVSPEDKGKVTRFATRFLENYAEYHWLLISEADAASYGWFSYGAGYGAPTMTLEEFQEAMRALRAAAGPRMVNPPSYDQVPGIAEKDLDSRTPLPDILESGLDILYFEERSPHPSSNWMMEEAMEGRELVVLLPTQSLEALRKRLPEDVELIDGDEEIRRLAREEIATVPDDVRAYLTANETFDRYYNADWDEAEKYYGKHLDQIVNDEFVAGVEAFRAAKEGRKNKPKNMDRVETAASFVGSVINFDTDSVPEVETVDALFPLLPHDFRYYYDKARKSTQVQHGIAYLNGLALTDMAVEETDEA